MAKLNICGYQNRSVLNKSWIPKKQDIVIYWQAAMYAIYDYSKNVSLSEHQPIEID